MLEGSCPSCEELRADLASARQRNADVLRRIELLKQNSFLLEEARQNNNLLKAELKKKVKEIEELKRVVVERDALKNDLTLMFVENMSYQEKIAFEQGRVVALRELNMELARKNKALMDEIKNDNAIINTSAMAQQFLKMQWETTKEELEKIKGKTLV